MSRNLPRIRRIRSGRNVPQEKGRTLISVVEDDEEGALIVQETTRSGRIIGETHYSADDPEISITRAIKDYLITHNFWGRRK